MKKTLPNELLNELIKNLPVDRLKWISRSISSTFHIFLNMYMTKERQMYKEQRAMMIAQLETAGCRYANLQLFLRNHIHQAYPTLTAVNRDELARALTAGSVKCQIFYENVREKLRQLHGAPNYNIEQLNPQNLMRLEFFVLIQAAIHLC